MSRRKMLARVRKIDPTATLLIGSIDFSTGPHKFDFWLDMCDEIDERFGSGGRHAAK